MASMIHIMKKSKYLRIFALLTLIVAASCHAQPSSNPVKFSSPKEFAIQLYPHAKKAAKQIGVDPRLLVAQAAHETNWGKSLPRKQNGQTSHNLFGMKANSTKNKTTTTTTEYVNNKRVKVKSGFRVYDSYDESFDDYARLISQSSRYKSAIKNGHDPLKYLQSLQQAGYASDPRYAIKIYEKYKSPIIQNLS